MFKLCICYFFLFDNDIKFYLCDLFMMIKSRLKIDFVWLFVINNILDFLFFVFRVFGFFVLFFYNKFGISFNLY